jgi:hypothetical protein
LRIQNERRDERRSAFAIGVTGLQLYVENARRRERKIQPLNRSKLFVLSLVDPI